MTDFLQLDHVRTTKVDQSTEGYNAVRAMEPPRPKGEAESDNQFTRILFF